ncbi:MAG: pyridoxamine 5'-phosphate oxidase family protein [Planctomycetota bacterium]|nr:MAG: pyridoxamine 5'-phosphate oxidase family protein [Planctomycetota bacterium]
MKISDLAREHLDAQVTIILGTASKTGEPNLAPMALYWVRDDHTVIIGDMYLRTSVEHVRENPRAQICFWDEANHKTFKYNGRVEYETEGENFAIAAQNFGLSGDDSDLKGVLILHLDQ